MQWQQQAHTFSLDCSETCTPLYPPHVFYLQLLSEQRSRVNACAKEGGGIADVVFKCVQEMDIDNRMVRACLLLAACAALA